jgi:hypothetical protein
MYDLFNGIVSSSDCTASNDSVISELERMWKKEVVAEFEALPQHLPGETEENHQKTSVRTADLRVET